MEIDAKISIMATYDDAIKISVLDNNARITFLEMTMTREQFINATMNRLSNTDVMQTTVQGLDNVGKKLVVTDIEVEVPENEPNRPPLNREELAAKKIIELCPEGSQPDLYLRSQGSFFFKDGKLHARTTLRRWE